MGVGRGFCHILGHLRAFRGHVLRRFVSVVLLHRHVHPDTLWHVELGGPSRGTGTDVLREASHLLPVLLHSDRGLDS